jgi:hypothetical protein
VAQAMWPRWGKANEGVCMNDQQPLDGERRRKAEMLLELPPSPAVTYRYERDFVSSGWTRRNALGARN